MNAIKITAEGKPEDIKFTDEQPLWMQLGTQVGGYFEIVRHTLQDAGMPKDIVMVVNDEGLIRDMPYNRVASLLYPGRICGDVLLMKECYTDEGPDFVEMTSADLLIVATTMKNLIMKMISNTEKITKLKSLNKDTVDMLVEAILTDILGSVKHNHSHYDEDTKEERDEHMGDKRESDGDN